MQGSVLQLITLSSMVKIVWGDCPASGIIQNGLTQGDIDTVINEHNKYRLAIANGQYGQNAGVNIKRMKWHTGLASTAQDWANKCKFEHNAGQVTNAGFIPIGQNLAWTASTVDQRGADFARVIKMWFDEVANFIYPNGKKDPTKATGHYTQVIWANTEYVGCGFSYYKGPTYYEKLYVCNYGPAGNYVNQAPYLRAHETTIRCPNLC